MEKIRSKGGSLIAFQRSGAGPPLVLVHGTLATHARWGNVSKRFAKHFTVYAIDRRGRGESGDKAPYAIEREFEDVAAMVDSIGTTVNLLGHSHGALCVLEAALLTPNVRSLIAYEPPLATAPNEVIERIETLLQAGYPEKAVITFVRDIVRMPPHEIEQWRTTSIFPSRVAAAHTIPREYRAVEGYQLMPERFQNMKVPALLLVGGDSPSFFQTNIENWHAALPNSQIISLSGQQHIAMDTAPDLFVNAVTSFLVRLN